MKVDATALSVEPIQRGPALTAEAFAGQGEYVLKADETAIDLDAT